MIYLSSQNDRNPGDIQEVNNKGKTRAQQSHKNHIKTLTSGRAKEELERGRAREGQSSDPTLAPVSEKLKYDPIMPQRDRIYQIGQQNMETRQSYSLHFS